MRVWIVNPFDNLPLEGNRPQRYWLMARAFARAGHETVYWTSDFSHARKARRVLAPGAAGWKGDGFRLELISTPPYPRNICLRRLWSHAVTAFRWKTRAAGETERPDVVVASVPPLALADAARAYCRRVGAFFVADIQDAWPETFERVAPRCLLAPLAWTARRIYRSADAVSGVAERYLALARAAGAAAPMRLAPLGAERLSGAAADGTAAGGDCEPLRLVYAGNMGASYDLETVVAAVRGLPNVTLDLAGAGPKETALRAAADGCARVRFHGYLDAAALRALLRGAHAGVIPMFDDACVGMPGKTGDYLCAGLPVINSLSGEPKRLLEACGAGVTYTAGDAASFRAAVEALRGRLDAARAGARALAARFDADVIYPAYVTWVEETVRGRSGCKAIFKRTIQ